MDGGGGRKRARSGGATDAAIKRAIAINARERRDFPRAAFGYAHYKRGSPTSRELFGASFKTASPAQQERRRELGFVGQGGYWAQKLFGVAPGSKWDRVADRVADLAASIPTVGRYVKPALEHSANFHREITASGAGEYLTNAIIDGGARAAPVVPKFAGGSGGIVTISHREYIGDVVAPPLVGGVPDNFGSVSYQINPGLEKTFPWLSQIAVNYEEYTLHQCIFTFRSTVADFAAASGQVGQVVMATQYNAASEPFSDKRTMMEYDAAMSCKTSESLLHGVECDPAKLSGPKGRFVRANPVELSQDINQYDHGQLNVAVCDTPATYAGQTMGELWVTYTIELRKPRFYSGKGFSISRDVFVCKSPGNMALGFGTALSGLGLGQQNSIGCVAKLPTSAVDYSLADTSFKRIYNKTTGTADYTAMGASTLVSIRLKFPDSYSAAVRLLLMQLITNAAGDNAGYDVYARGNIRPIFDSMGTNDQYTATGQCCNNTVAMLETVDMYVDQAGNGIANELALVFVGNGVGPVTLNSELDLSEYNISMSAKQDGSNDALVTVNNLGAAI